MATQRFVGTTVREVLIQVREAFGDDAIIIEQSHANGEVVVLATAEPLPEQAAAADLTPSDGYQRLLRTLGFSQSFADRLRITLPTLRHLLDATLEQLALDESRANALLSGVVQFVGADAPGRSTALIQSLCARAIADGGGLEDVVVISEVGQSLGGAEALRLACQALGVEHQCLSRERLRTQAAQRMATAGPQRGLVLIDREPGDARTLALPTDRTVFVLPSVLHPEVTRNELRCFEPIATDVFVTQIDKSPAWGHWLEPICAAGLTPRWASVSARPGVAAQPIDRRTVRDALVDQIEKSESATTFQG